MTLAAQLHEWASGLPAWQQQLLAACARDSAPSDADIASAADALLRTPDERPPEPLVSELDFADADDQLVAQLLAFEEVCHVNRFKDGVGLTFEPVGLTACYGRNGAGKTGYTRLAKHVGRTQSPEETLGNVFDPPSDPPRASLRVRVAGSTKSLQVDLSESASTPLASMPVFDEDSGNQYLVEETEVDYAPAALEVLTRLCRAIDRVRAHLKDAGEAIELEPLPLASMAEGSMVRKLLASDSPDEQGLKLLASISDAEQSELEALEQRTAVARAGRIDALRTSAQRRARELAALADVMELAQRQLDAIGATELEHRLGDLHEAQRLEREAGQPESGDRLIEGLGSPAWKAMWEGVEDFSREVLGHEFPPDAEDARCPTCLQPLAEGDKARLGRLKQLVHSRASEKVEEIAGTLRRELASLPDRSEAERLLAAATGSFGESDERLAEACKRWMREYSEFWTAATGLSAKGLPAFPAAPAKELRDRVVSAEREAQELAKAEDQQQARVDGERLAELSARAELKNRWDSIVRALRQRKQCASFERAATLATTAAISRKKREFSAAFVTKEFQDELRRQVSSLRADMVEIRCHAREVRGVTQCSLTFVSASDESLKRVLSRGEQRRLSLAVFLTEARIGFPGQPLFLDDPMSSLDIDGRRHVARTLAEMAQERQVIVLTHDLAFLWELNRAARDAGTPLGCRSIFESGGACGHTSRELPWDGKNAKKRLKELRKWQQELEKMHREGDLDYDSRVDDFCMAYRKTLERIVLEEAAGDLVSRADDQVKLTNVSKVAVDARVSHLVEQALVRSSAWMHDRHDDAPAPDPGELKVGLTILADLRSAIETRRDGLRAELRKLTGKKSQLTIEDLEGGDAEMSIRRTGVRPEA